MPLEPVIALVCGLVILGTIIAWGLRISARSHDAVRAHVRDVNTTLETVAHALGLESSKPAPYVHPMVGSFENYADARGVHRGRSLRLSVWQDEDLAEIRVYFEPASPRRWPKLGRVSYQKIRGTWPALASAVLALELYADKIDVSPDELSIVPKGVQSGPTLTQRVELRSDPQQLCALIDAAVGVAAELDRLS